MTSSPDVYTIHVRRFPDQLKALEKDRPALETLIRTFITSVRTGGRLMEEETVLDVRQTPPARRHRLILETFESLQPGESFILINDHDPKPLYYEFKFEREGQFTWEYLERGPEVWRVRIGKGGGR